MTACGSRHIRGCFGSLARSPDEKRIRGYCCRLDCFRIILDITVGSGIVAPGDVKTEYISMTALGLIRSTKPVARAQCDHLGMRTRRVYWTCGHNTFFRSKQDLVLWAGTRRMVIPVSCMAASERWFTSRRIAHLNWSFVVDPALKKDT
jgi:hypothetical protein